VNITGYILVGPPALGHRLIGSFYDDCYTVKAKEVPLQPWTGPEVSRKLRFPDLKTIVT
jgi:hypothetical protein